MFRGGEIIVCVEVVLVYRGKWLGGGVFGGEIIVCVEV